MSECEELLNTDVITKLMTKLSPKEREVIEESISIEQKCICISIWLGFLRFRVMINTDINAFGVDIDRCLECIYPNPRFPELVKIKNVKLLAKIIDILKELGFEEGW